MDTLILSPRDYAAQRLRELVSQVPPMVEPVAPPETVLLTPPEAAKLLAICEKTLWSLTKQRKIASVRIGTSVRYSKRDVLAFIESTKSAGQQDRGE